MKHMTNKQAIYKAVESMNGEPFTAYDILSICKRDLTVQSVSCIVKGIPNVRKIRDQRQENGPSVWQVCRF